MTRYEWFKIIRSIHEGQKIKPRTFHQMLNTSATFKMIQEKSLKTGSTGQFFLSLVKVNLGKLGLCFLLFTLTLALNISSPWLINYIVHQLLGQDRDGALLGYLVLLMMGYKVLSMLVNILCDFMYSSLGYQYLVFLLWNILKIEHIRSGKMGKIVNIVQYDCNLISNLVYSALTSIFFGAQILVLFTVLSKYLINTQPYSAFITLIIGYVICQISSNLLTFHVNRKYLIRKDKRLDSNIGHFDSEKIRQERNKQLAANKAYLLSKVLSKLVSIVFPLLINVYVFLVADRQMFQQNQYTIFILINLIRSPISSFMLAMNLNVQIWNSCKRVIQVFICEQYDSDSLLSQDNSQIAVNVDSVQILDRTHQVGRIEFDKIVQELKFNVPLKDWILVFSSLVLLLGSRFYGNKVSRQMIDRQTSASVYIGLSAQIIAPLLLFLTLIFSLQKVAAKIFTKLPKQIDYQMLNRISGDIASVDRSVTFNTFEIGSNLTLILGSYLYSCFSLGLDWLTILLVIFLALAAWVAYSFNRFLMSSRRQVYRYEVEMKSQILAGLIRNQKIGESERLKSSCRSIYECKMMGLLIQNYYTLWISTLILLMSVSMIILSHYTIEETSIKSIVVMLCLSIDNDMLLLFYAMVRLELSLVSFERVINVLRLQ